jgi:competence protein ComEC
LPAAWIAAIARTVEALPGSSLPWLEGGAGFAIAAIAAGAGAALILTRARHRGGLRAACAAILCVVVVGLAGTLGGGRASNSLRASGEWAIVACDIGQGDAFVVRSAGSFALVDTGPKPAALTACLERLGIERIDLLILTHYDLDHVGGTAAVVGRVGTALVGPSEGGRDVRLADDLGRGGATVRQAGRGDHGRLGNLTWRILWPRTDSTLMQTGNEGSVTVAFDGDGITSLFLGDLGRDSQNAMMAANTLGEFDVVKVAHHGSADQSEALYQRVHARLGLISVGVGNPYGHPRDSLLGILERAGTKAARTDREGMIMVSVDRSSPGTLRVWSERPDTSPRESVGARG